MQYDDGNTIKLADRVRLINGEVGTVVLSIDTGEYAADFKKEDWEYLQTGILVRTENGALVHLTDVSPHKPVRA